MMSSLPGPPSWLRRELQSPLRYPSLAPENQVIDETTGDRINAPESIAPESVDVAVSIIYSNPTWLLNEYRLETVLSLIFNFMNQIGLLYNQGASILGADGVKLNHPIDASRFNLYEIE